MIKMAKGILLALSNPSAADREAEYNTWYNDIHANEATSLRDVEGVTRYRAAAHVSPALG
jgi:hypothetical protein